MSTSVQGRFLDGVHLAGPPATIVREGDQLIVHTPQLRQEFRCDAARATESLGRIPRYLYLPGGATFVTEDHAALEALLPPTHRARLSGWLHWLESRASYAAAATVLLAVLAFLGVSRGLPAAARTLAHRVPPSLDTHAGEVALAGFSRFTAPTALPPSRCEHVRRLAADLAAVRGLSAPRVEFRSMGGKFPNAFALPGGIIVVTDELVQLAASDGEIQAVLAHELGHVRERHGIQGVLRSSAALLVVSLVTGDLSALTTFSASIPFVLLQRGYSREFEHEADEYAVETLRLAGIDTVHFATMLGKLEGSRQGLAVDYSYLSTHPHTTDRIARVRGLAPLVAGTQPDGGSTAVGFMPPTAPLSTEEPRELPQPLFQVPPEYPFQLRAAGKEGTVMVAFIVDRSGNVAEASVAASDNPGFDEAALAAVRQWRFRPGLINGQPVNTQMNVPIVFNLRENTPPSFELMAPSRPATNEGGPPIPTPGR